ncbi:hypothetical protein [Paenibacillus ihumii]|uniref:hypothetical protein n=1 Tax=Paenibacillus ihumii TaxID=687436 RepID=UPI000B1C24C3|nr:hypothetical protein [Paenibacillus ihumii]
MRARKDKRELNKSAVTTLIISMALPFFSISISNFKLVGDSTYAIGFPIRFLYYFSENLPRQKYQLYTWDMFTQFVSLRGHLYLLNVVLIYLTIEIIKKTYIKLKNSSST